MTEVQYPTDLTDAQWELVRELLPPRQRLGRKQTDDRRQVVNAVLYLVRTGCQWRMLPREYPPGRRRTRFFIAGG